VIKIEEKKK